MGAGSRVMWTECRTLALPAPAYDPNGRGAAPDSRRYLRNVRSVAICQSRRRDRVLVAEKARRHRVEPAKSSTTARRPSWPARSNGPQRMAGAQLHGPVDVRRRSDPLLHRAVGLVDDRELDRVPRCVVVEAGSDRSGRPPRSPGSGSGGPASRPSAYYVEPAPVLRPRRPAGDHRPLDRRRPETSGFVEPLEQAPWRRRG